MSFGGLLIIRSIVSNSALTWFMVYVCVCGRAGGRAGGQVGRQAGTHARTHARPPTNLKYRRQEENMRNKDNNKREQRQK